MKNILPIAVVTCLGVVLCSAIAPKANAISAAYRAQLEREHKTQLQDATDPVKPSVTMKTVRVGRHQVTIDSNCEIHQVDHKPVNFLTSVSGHIDYVTQENEAVEVRPWPNRHQCMIYAGESEKTVKF